MKCFKNFNITATEQDIDEFVLMKAVMCSKKRRDFRRSKPFILKDSKKLMKMDDEDDSMDADTTSQRLQASNTLDNVYATYFIQVFSGKAIYCW